MHIDVNGLRLAYDDSGGGGPQDAPTLLFIHGYPLNRRIWQPQLEGLSGAARVLALDLRGHGESQIVPGPYWMDTLAGDCAAFLDALGISRPVVVCGLSMGGYVAMAFYRQYELRIAGLILSATRAGADTEQARANRDKAAHLAREEGPLAVAESMLPKMLAPKTYDRKPELVESVRKIMESTPVEAIEGDLIGMRERPDSMETLKEVLAPTLILHGADDQIIPVKEAEAMHRAVSHSDLELIPNAGHLLNLEQPEMFNHAVRFFLGSNR
jgi:pimeloyl-ACP methyl ester carboxylesterase